MGVFYDAVNFLHENANPIAVMLGVVAVAVILTSSRFKDYLRGRTMKQQRRQEIHNLLTAGFTDVIEDRVADGTITRQEATEEGYLPLQRAYPRCKDLSTSEAWLKERIEKRMKSGVHEPVALPTGERKLLFARRK